MLYLRIAILVTEFLNLEHNLGIKELTNVFDITTFIILMYISLLNKW